MAGACYREFPTFIMPRLERLDLEQPRSRKRVWWLLRDFENDPGVYSDEEIYGRPGVVKVLLEEYYPLSALAERLRCVRSIRLMPLSNEGPDAEVRFWFLPAMYVQITCAGESDHHYQQALVREELGSRGTAFAFQQRHRDKKTGQIIAEGAALASAEGMVSARVNHIREAIERKRKKYRRDTDVLLVADDSAHWGYLERLQFIDRVREMFGALEPVPYPLVYVCFRDRIVRLK